MQWIYGLLGFFIFFQAQAWAQAKDRDCRVTQTALTELLNVLDKDYEEQELSSQGQRYRAFELWADVAQVQQIIQDLDAAQDGAFFTLTNESQMWLLRQENCFFSLHVNHNSTPEGSVVFLFWLGSADGTQPRLWKTAQRLPLTLMHQHLDSQLEHELLIYYWEQDKQMLVKEILHEQGLQAHYLNDCMPHRLCFMAQKEWFITLFWSDYSGQDYLLVWVQRCGDCDVDTK